MADDNKSRNELEQILTETEYTSEVSKVMSRLLDKGYRVTCERSTLTDNIYGLEVINVFTDGEALRSAEEGYFLARTNVDRFYSIRKVDSEEE